MRESKFKEHPNHRITHLSEKELLSELTIWSRNDLIEWLSWNDPNGVYDDVSSMREFNNVMSLEEGIEIIVRQIIESR